MKKFLIASVAALTLSAASALAADLRMPVKAPPPAPEPWYDWSGFYIGLNGGYSWGNSTTTFTGTSVTPGGAIAPFSTSQSMNGWLGGGQIGYNWQFNKNWLLGVEADIQGTGQSGSVALPTVTGNACALLVCPFTTTGSLAQKLPWFGTVRARLGVEPSDHWLLYVTGGLAFGEIDSTLSVTNTVLGVTVTSASAHNTTQAGWTIGGGVEGVITGRWTAKAEYLYMDFGTITNAFTPGLGGFATLNTSSHVTDNIFRVGINYHFGGPVAARY
jgi:outer membrane immunogenic protein